MRVNTFTSWQKRSDRIHEHAQHAHVPRWRKRQSTVRAEDLFCRYGGEEFSILCRGIPLLSAGSMAERLRALVESAEFVFDAREIPVTISLGVAAMPDLPAQNGTELIAAADEALYAAKHAGRNRVCLKQ